jgi:hypothetical protein
MDLAVRRAVVEDSFVLSRMRWENTGEDGARDEQAYAEFAAGFAEFVY